MAEFTVLAKAVRQGLDTFVTHKAWNDEKEQADGITQLDLERYRKVAHNYPYIYLIPS